MVAQRECDNYITVQAGSTWIDVYSAFKTQGGLWTVVGGLSPTVGVTGYLQGGGVGQTARQLQTV